MEKGYIKQLLIDAIKKSQSLSGEKTPDLNDDTIPIGQCPGFDSLKAVEVIVGLEAQLDLKMLGDANLFVSEYDGKPLKIIEIVDRLYRLIPKPGKKSHG